MSKILIFFSNRLFADGLEAIIEKINGFSIDAVVPLKSGLFDYLKNGINADILIIELNCPRNPDVNLITSLTIEYPLLKKLIISVMPQNSVAAKILESGIDAYLLKSCTGNDIHTALSKIKENSVYYCSDITKRIVVNEYSHPESEKLVLTAREKEILSMLVNCMSNNEIAGELELSENTIKTHRRNIQSKFGSKNIIGMIRYACRNNLIEFGSSQFCSDCPHCAAF